MHLDVFLAGETLRSDVEVLLRAYPALFDVRWHDEPAPELYQQLWIASYPLDACTGHALGPDEICEPLGYDYGYGLPPQPATVSLGLFDRVALVAAPGRVTELRPGVWSVSFEEFETLRAGFYRAFADALSALGTADLALMKRRPELSEEEAAVLLEVTVPALRRAREVRADRGRLSIPPAR